MAIYRNVQTAFWSDMKVEEEFTPEDKYFYLYLFTNPHTNLCGCYQLGLTQASSQTGYNKDSIEKLIGRFSDNHEVIKYSKETKEIYIKNWHKYNWTKSSKFLSPLRKEIAEIEDEDFRRELGTRFDEYLAQALENARDKELERLSNIPYIYGMHTTCMDTTVTVTDTITNTISSSNSNINKDYINNSIKEIIDYLNNILNSNYQSNTESTRRFIKARLNEGFTVDDFYEVIDKKYKEWHGTSMEKFLRPQTLFGTKFESYLNQTIIEDAKPKNEFDLLRDC